MDFLLYLLKVNIAIILFYGFYKLFFQQDTFFQWKRMALLAIVFISFAYPFADIVRNLSHSETVEIGIFPIYTLPEVTVFGQATAGQTVSFAQSLPQLLSALYGIVVLLLLVRLLIQTGTIIRMMQGAQKAELYGQTVYRHPEIKTPFSFFRWIVLNPALYTDTEVHEILRHEETHVREVHSIDTLLSELLCVFCWFNPLAWLLKREIRMNLEFLADRSVLASGYEAEHYQFHLLRLTYHKAAAKITNNFNVSLLKKRIFMMNKKQTSKLSIFKYTLLIPVVGALLFFNSVLKLQAGIVKTTEITKMVETLKRTLSDETVKANETVESQKPVVRDLVGQYTLVESQEQIYSHVEVMPRFPGGDAAMMKYLNENMRYPESAQEQKIQGRVVLRFVVTAEGSIENTEVQRSLDPACDQEAIRVVQNMPKWEPGKQNGEPVSVYFTLPVLFKLPENDAGAKKQDIPDSPIDIAGKQVYVEVRPYFPGGEKGLVRYLADNIHYPVVAQEEKIQGRVIVRFVIGPDGSVSDVETIRSLHPACDREAMRVVQNMPNWIPGKLNGQPLSEYYTLPVLFKLQGNDAGAKQQDNSDSATDPSETKHAISEIIVVGYGATDTSETTKTTPDNVIEK